MFVEVSTPHPYKANLQRSVADKTEPMAVQKKKMLGPQSQKKYFFQNLARKCNKKWKWLWDSLLCQFWQN